MTAAATGAGGSPERPLTPSVGAGRPSGRGQAAGAAEGIAATGAGGSPERPLTPSVGAGRPSGRGQAAGAAEGVAATGAGGSPQRSVTTFYDERRSEAGERSMGSAESTAGQPWTGVASIGSVLGRLKSEFPDVSISKIRFLESEGLVTPHRTPSGYRQFSAADVERLRYVLAAQRDHYLPLKVIKEHLDAIDRGLEPATPESTAAPGSGVRRFPRSERRATSRRPTQIRMTRAELLAESGLEASDLTELEQYGLLAAGHRRLLRRRRGIDRHDRRGTVGGRPRAASSAPVPDGRRTRVGTGRPVGVGPGPPEGPRCPRAGRSGSGRGRGHRPAPARPARQGRATP